MRHIGTCVGAGTLRAGFQHRRCAAFEHGLCRLHPVRHFHHQVLNVLGCVVLLQQAVVVAFFGKHPIAVHSGDGNAVQCQARLCGHKVLDGRIVQVNVFKAGGGLHFHNTPARGQIARCGDRHQHIHKHPCTGRFKPGLKQGTALRQSARCAGNFELRLRHHTGRALRHHVKSEAMARWVKNLPGHFAQTVARRVPRLGAVGGLE